MAKPNYTAQSKLTIERLRELLNYDPQTGIFIWRIRPKKTRVVVGSVAGSIRGDYWCIKIDGHKFNAGRVAWFYVTGEWPANYIDHKHGDKLNNAFANIRDITPQENSQNRRLAKSNNKSSGLLGVQKSRGRWMMRILLPNGKRICSTHGTKEAAYDAYLDAKRNYHSGNML